MQPLTADITEQLTVEKLLVPLSGQRVKCILNTPQLSDCSVFQEKEVMGKKIKVFISIPIAALKIFCLLEILSVYSECE